MRNHSRFYIIVKPMVKIGEKAPDFVLKDQDGKERSLSEFKGKKVLLYFYPRDFTPGCTKEACGIRDNFEGFRKLDVVVLGVSTDSVDRHKRFAQKHNLPFILLSDEKAELSKKYGVWRKKKLAGREYFGIARTSFLIDEEGKIIKIYEKVKPEIHAREVLEDLKKLAS